jgi:eight-cysteine-cluster-containing protein
MRYIVLCVLAVLLTVGCGSTSENSEPPKTGTGDQTAEPGTGGETGQGGEVRTAAVAADHALYARVEGTSVNNACASDADCKPSGCSKEVCASEEAMSTCEVQEWPQGEGASCGCVEKQCVWYR